MATNDKPLRNVLVMRLSVLGNVAMTIPVLYPVCKANPDTRFIMLTKMWPASMFHDRPANLKVVDFDVKEKHHGLFGLLKLARQLYHLYDIDAVADLHNVSGTWIIDAYMRLHGAKIARFDREKSKRKALTTHRTNEPLTPVHERYRNVFRQLGFETPDNFTHLYDGRDWPVSPIVLEKEEGQRWIAISPFSSHTNKSYPLDQMEKVIAELTKHENYWALFAKCDLMLTMESANMHLASLVDLQAMTIWGPTSPDCGYLGYNQIVEDDIQLDMDCRPCSINGDKPCKYGDYRCLKNISPEYIAQHVVEAVEFNAKNKTKGTKLALLRQAKHHSEDTNS